MDYAEYEDRGSFFLESNRVVRREGGLRSG